MRDPMNWALPVFRAFGIPVKLHVFFIVVSLGMFIRQVTAKDNPIDWGDVLLFTVVLLFVVILIHELGHCFAGRAVGGEAREILIWPLGGLAYVELPNTPRAHLLTAAAGPGTNALLCVLLAVPLLAAGYVPNTNPVSNPFVSEMRGFDGKTYTSEYGLKVYHKKDGQSWELMDENARLDAANKQQETGLQNRVAWKPETAAEMAERMEKQGGVRALAPGGRCGSTVPSGCRGSCSCSTSSRPTRSTAGRCSRPSSGAGPTSAAASPSRPTRGSCSR